MHQLQEIRRERWKLASPKTLALVIGATILLVGIIWYLLLPVAQVSVVHRGTALSAVYGTVRIEPTLVIHVRAQNSGFIKLADEFATGRSAIGKPVEKGQLLAAIADETTARQLKQAQADLQAANERAALPLPSTEPLKTAEDNVQRLEKLAALSNVPAVEYEKAKSEAARLRGAVESERIERDRNLQSLADTCKRLEAQLKSSEIRSPIEGLLTGVGTVEGELVAQNSDLFTVSSRQNFVRGEVNEEDVGDVKPGMEAVVQLYAYRLQNFPARVSSVQPAADPETQRYTIVLKLDKPPDNLMAGMTGEMNIITGRHENVILVPTRALLVDQALVIKHGIVQRRTVKTGFGTLDSTEAMDGIAEGEHVVVEDQDVLQPGRPVRQRIVDPAKLAVDE